MPEDSVAHDPDEPTSRERRPTDSSIPSSSDPAPEGIDGILDPIADDQVERIVAEEAAAARRVSAIEAGRRKGGAAGAAMAGAMLAISDIIEGPRNDEIVAVSESPDEPDDIDTAGITVSLDGQEFWASPPDGGDDPESDPRS